MTALLAPAPLLAWERPTILGAAFLAVVLGVVGLAGPVGAWLARRRERALAVQRRLYRTRPVALSVAGAPLLGLLVFLLVGMAASWVLGALLGYVTFRFTDSFSAAAVRRRALRFEGQLVEALTTLANGVKAGLSLPQAVAQVARDAPAPTSEEFGAVMRDYDGGKTIEQALDDARGRIESRNFDLAVRAFRVGLEHGGNVAEVFERIAASIREIWRLQEHVRTVTTEGRSSARFMTAMPAVFLLLLFVMDSEGMGLMFTTALGLSLLAGVLVINLLAHVWIRRILDVDV